jgi:hypothetical protein
MVQRMASEALAGFVRDDWQTSKRLDESSPFRGINPYFVVLKG